MSNKVQHARVAKKPLGKSISTTRRPGAVAAKSASESSMSVSSGFRDKLIASLDQAGVPARGRVAYVASVTCRAVQTVNRWLDPNQRGLPDLESCARLCEGLGSSSDWMLGLSSYSPKDDASSRSLSTAEIAWAREVFEAARGDSTDCDVMRMAGDEMAPRIRDGDLMFVDHSANQLAGNGIYALEVDGRLLVRRLETRLGTGLVFKCENESYASHTVKNAAAAKRLGLRVVGKVVGAVGVTHFWRI